MMSDNNVITHPGTVILLSNNTAFTLLFEISIKRTISAEVSCLKN